MKLIAYPLSPTPDPIRPGPVGRDWMDLSDTRFARRCLPLLIANQHSWELRLRETVTAQWDGGESLQSLLTEGPAISVFGRGVLTFHVPYLFRTEPGWNLWVKGPSNFVKGLVHPLEGIVETDWTYTTFTMNWMFDSEGAVRFHAGEPFCSIIPVQRGMIASIEPEIRDLKEDDPDLLARYVEWRDSRMEFYRTRTGEDAWQKHYHKGITLDGEKFSEHEHKLRVKEFVDTR